MALILPEGTVDAWQAAHDADTVHAWCNVADTLWSHADAERDLVLRGDIITLARLAGHRVFAVLRRAGV